ncbi:uncharacterized protein LOC115242064 [Formica exsecta]|uniref:uncharacterized protein LOC115242064 n=1 Tax=Formica exsecta TaxID=72781 RepID=UPI001144D2C8|nr:uncharacterized protein LOC115242064 [Formica exsecta]
MYNVITNECCIYFEVNIRTINTKGIQALQDAVLFNGHYYNVKCQQKNSPETVIETIRSHFHIFIDLDTRTHRKKTHGVKCQLADVPVTLNFGKHLIGVIEHIPGHFIDYCQKPSGRWLKCDDMQLIVEGCDETTVITPIGAIYIAL